MALDTLRVPAHDEPTFFNRTALVGLALGLILPVGPIVPLAAMVIGGFMGRSRMANEREYGKVVSRPGFFKLETLKDAVIGAGVGSLLGTAALLLFVAVDPTSLVSGLQNIMAGQFGQVSAGVWGGLAAVAVAPLVGLVTGAWRGKARMAQEWSQAQAYVQEHGEYRAPAISQSRDMQPQQEQAVGTPYKNSVSPKEHAQLEERLQRAHHAFAPAIAEKAAKATEMHATR